MRWKGFENGFGSQLLDIGLHGAGELIIIIIIITSTLHFQWKWLKSFSIINAWLHICTLGRMYFTCNVKSWIIIEWVQNQPLFQSFTLNLSQLLVRLYSYSIYKLHAQYSSVLLSSYTNIFLPHVAFMSSSSSYKYLLNKQKVLNIVLFVCWMHIKIKIITSLIEEKNRKFMMILCAAQW